MEKIYSNPKELADTIDGGTESFSNTDLNMTNSKNNEYIEYMDTDLVDKYKEYDREEDYKGNDSYLSSLEGHIKDNGFEEPLIMSYNPTNGVTRLTEGNHRLAVAKRLGIKSVPVRMVRNNYITGDDPRHGFGIVDTKLSKMYADRQAQHKDHPERVDDFLNFGSPSDMKPSEWFSGEELSKIKPYQRVENPQETDYNNPNRWYNNGRWNYTK